MKSEAPFQEMIPGKTPEKSETVSNTFVSIIKQNWKKMAEIPQEHDILTWGIQTLVRKMKQPVRKYTQFVVINIAPLMVLFVISSCFLIAHLLICNCLLLKDLNFNPKYLLVWCD